MRARHQHPTLSQVREWLLDLPRPPLAYVAGFLVTASLIWSVYDLMSHLLHAG